MKNKIILGFGIIGLAGMLIAANVPGMRLASGKLLVGDSSGNAQPVTISGDITIDNAGVAATANNSVGTADIAANVIVSADIDQNVLQVDNTQLTNTNMLALEATPISLISAPAANTAIIVHQVCVVLDAAAGAYTESSDDIVIEYTTGGVDIVQIDSTDGFDDAAVTTRCYKPLQAGTNMLPLSGANTACTTTCGGLRCVSATDGTNFVTCADATADSCLCDAYSTIGTAASAVQVTTVGSGEFGGGNAANTLSIRIWYSLQPMVAFSTGG